MNAPDRLPERRWPRLLAAYADGELDAAGRARVEAWLAANPDARADLEAQRRLGPRGPLWEASAAPQSGPPAPALAAGSAGSRIASGVSGSLVDDVRDFRTRGRWIPDD